MATSAVMQKILSVDQLRAKRQAGGIFDCNAAGCYDRIIPPLASIHLQALGLGYQIATILARLMFMAKRHVRTKHGVSSKGIRTKKTAPLYGIGLVNGGETSDMVDTFNHHVFCSIHSLCQASYRRNKEIAGTTHGRYWLCR